MFTPSYLWRCFKTSKICRTDDFQVLEFYYSFCTVKGSSVGWNRQRILFSKSNIKFTFYLSTRFSAHKHRLLSKFNSLESESAMNGLFRICKRNFPANIRLDEDVLKNMNIFAFIQDVLMKANIFLLIIHLQKTSSRCLQDVLVKTNIFVLSIRLQDVFKISSRRLAKTSSRRLANTS